MNCAYCSNKGTERKKAKTKILLCKSCSKASHYSYDGTYKAYRKNDPNEPVAHEIKRNINDGYTGVDNEDILTAAYYGCVIFLIFWFFIALTCMGASI